MSKKSDVKMVQLNVEFKDLDPLKYSSLYSIVQNLITSARVRKEPRADESIIRNSTMNADTRHGIMILILSEPLAKKVRPFIKKTGGQVVAEFDYHRVAFGKIHSNLIEEGYKCVRKFTSEDGDKLHMYQAPGRPTLLVTLPTFLVLKQILTDLGLPRAG